jgi:hypothetical protein
MMKSNFFKISSYTLQTVGAKPALYVRSKSKETYRIDNKCLEQEKHEY